MDSEISKNANEKYFLCFKLIDVYEMQIDVAAWQKKIRIEIFQSTTESHLFRARVWLSEHYNLYPSEFNTDAHGNDLRSLHSADVLNKDISSIFPFANELNSGKMVASKEIFVGELISQISGFFESAQTRQNES